MARRKRPLKKSGDIRKVDMPGHADLNDEPEIVDGASTQIDVPGHRDYIDVPGHRDYIEKTDTPEISSLDTTKSKIDDQISKDDLPDK